MKFFVKVKPSAKQEKIEKIDKNTFAVSIKESPDRGRANEALIKALAKYFGVSKSNVKSICHLGSVPFGVRSHLGSGLDIWPFGPFGIWGLHLGSGLDIWYPSCFISFYQFANCRIVHLKMSSNLLLAVAEMLDGFYYLFIP